MQVLILLGCVVYAACSGYKDQGYEKEYGKEYESYSKQVYHGQYTGRCGADGFYMNDGASFVMCSNGNSYVQPCAPGSRNSNAKHYRSGDSYSSRDFCDVNLVDYGYTLYYGNRDYGYQDNSYKRGYDKRDSYGYKPQGYGYNKGYDSYGGYGYGNKYDNYGYGGYDNAYGAGYGGDKKTYGSNKNTYGDDNAYGVDKKGYGSYKVEYYGKGDKKYA